MVLRRSTEPLKHATFIAPRVRGWVTTLGLLSIGMLGAMASPVHAQQPGAGRHPLWHPSIPPGVAGSWAVQRGFGSQVCFQLMRFELPKAGRVTLYDRSPDHPIELETPAQAGLLVGPMYRFKISHMPDFPGVELYPSVELIDRIHPPPGRAAEFPIPILLSDDEIRTALAGRMVTKVIYLEQPDRAQAERVGRNLTLPGRTISPRENVLHDADLRGRPLLILRLGGRTPNPEGEDPGFYGVGAPILIPEMPVREFPMEGIPDRDAPVQNSRNIGISE